jgi:hypothetical protein
VLLSAATIIANTSDQGMRSDGTAPWIGDPTIRSGDTGNGSAEQVMVIPFLLPTLPTGATITSAMLTMNLQSIANGTSIVGTDDLYGLAFRSSPTVLAGDYSEGAYGSASGTPLQSAFATKTTALGAVTTDTTGGTNLVNYLAAQYAAGGAGKYVFLRLNAQSDQITARFWAWYSGNAASGLQPTLSFTYDTTPAAPSNLQTVTNPGEAINLTWQNNAVTSTNVIVQRSTDGVSFNTIATLAPTATTYLDNTSLSPDTSYSYRVYATNSGIDSPYSNVATDKTLPAFAQTVWVDAINGNDTTGNGGFTTPYKTIAKAMASTAVKNNPAGTGLVLRGGTYTETAVLPSGSTGSPFTIMGEPGETAIISGFQAISGWTSVGGGVYSTTLTWNPDTLYVGYTPQDMSRQPDQGWFTAPSVVTSGTPSVTTITDPTHLNGLGNLVGSYVQIHGAAANAYYSAQVTAQDTVNGTISFNTPSGAVLANNDFYIVKNLQSLITRPGEWASISNGAGGYTLYFMPANVADLSSTQSRFMTGRQVQATGGAHDIVIRDLTVVGNRTGFGIDVEGKVVNNVPTFAQNITVMNNVVADNFNDGIWFRYVQNSLIKNNVVEANANGMGVADATNVTVDGNEIAYNITDGIDMVGDVSGRTIGSAGFSPSYDDTLSNNYIHDQLGYGHCDGIQLYNYVYRVNILDNVIRDCGQGIMSQQVDDTGTGPSSDWSTLSGNLIFDIDAYSVIFGHSNSYNWNVSDNTIGGSGYGPFSLTATGYNLTENILLGKLGITGSVAAQQYTGDRNFFYLNAYSQSAPYIISVSGPPWTNYSSVSAFYAATGQDQHSQSGDALLINAPAVETMMGNQQSATLTSLAVNSVVGFAVGDYIEINHDGVARKITAINTSTKTITFDTPLPVLPLSESVIVDNWKTNNTNFLVNMNLGAGSPALTMSSTGGPIGSQINLANDMAGDFDGDGKRDLPLVLPAIQAGMPPINNWPPPSY